MKTGKKKSELVCAQTTPVAFGSVVTMVVTHWTHPCYNHDCYWNLDKNNSLAKVKKRTLARLVKLFPLTNEQRFLCTTTCNLRHRDVCCCPLLERPFRFMLPALPMLLHNRCCFVKEAAWSILRKLMPAVNHKLTILIEMTPTSLHHNINHHEYYYYILHLMIAVVVVAVMR